MTAPLVPAIHIREETEGRSFGCQARLIGTLLGLTGLFGAVLGCHSKAPDAAPTVPHSANSSKGAATGPDRVASVVELLRQGKTADAEQRVVRLLAESPDDGSLLAVAGEVAMQSRNWSLAAARFTEAAKRFPSKQSRPLLLRAARANAHSHQLFESIALLRQVLDVAPDDAEARQELAGLLCALGMEWEAVEHLQWLAERGRAGASELIILADRNQPQTDEEWIREARQARPNDVRPEIGTARLLSHQGKWNESIALTTRILEQDARFLAAWILHGRSLYETRQQDQLQQWAASPIPGSDLHPDYWLILGSIAQEQQNLEAAARAFFECLRREPGNREALARLPPLLIRLNQPDLAVELETQAKRTEEMVAAASQFVTMRKVSPPAASEVAQAMTALGRFWEAEGWAKLAVAQDGGRSSEYREQHAAIVKRLKPGTPMVDPEHHPMRWEHHFAAWSLPHIESFASSSPPTAPRAAGPTLSTVRFEEQAAQRGIRFEFQNGHDFSVPGMRIWQAMGGGVGVLDYDLNGFPDVYFPQAGTKPLASEGPLPDQLYRNISGHFDEVSQACGTRDDRLSQGVSVGDYDQDGFPDLAVANIGENRLYRNQGDGTFRDVTREAGLSGGYWTTCMLIADLDGDSVNDLYEANYCTNDEAYSVDCYGGKDGKRVMSCSPVAFPAQPDRFWKGTGDGTFIDRTAETLQTEAPGRALGLMAADFDGKTGLELFVANDMTANHLWKWGPSDAFLEQAGIRGLANDSRGRSQACMGVALGDPDHDGDFDLLVTNFERENNAFYVQLSTGVFEDQAVPSGLGELSYEPLGFGVQLADFDGDHVLDAVVANGHVVDHPEGEWSFHMFPQGYSFSDKWHELPRDQLGSYFQKKHVGRGLALLDVDQDGWPDAVINQLAEPAALLINRSPQKRLSLTVELVAIHSPRDAVGARVEIDVEGIREVRWKTAGDGFEGSNQSTLWFPVPQGPHRVQVRWPSGNEEIIEDVEPGSYLIVEGSSRAVPRNPSSTH